MRLEMSVSVESIDVPLASISFHTFASSGTAQSSSCAPRATRELRHACPLGRKGGGAGGHQRVLHGDRGNGHQDDTADRVADEEGLGVDREQDEEDAA